MTAATHEAVEELLGAYALDALERDERETVEEHLTSCSRCQAEVGWHLEVASHLAGGGGPAPAGVWDRIAAAIEADAASQPPPLRLVVGRGESAAPSDDAVAAALRRRRWARPLLGAAAAAAVVAVSLLSLQVVRQQQRLDEKADDLAELLDQNELALAANAALVDPTARRTELRTESGDTFAIAAVLPSGEGYLVAQDLPVRDEGIYQLWGVVGEDVVSLGVLSGDGRLMAFSADEGTSALALTEEDAPVVRSRNDPIVAGQLA